MCAQTLTHLKKEYPEHSVTINEYGDTVFYTIDPKSEFKEELFRLFIISKGDSIAKTLIIAMPIQNFSRLRNFMDNNKEYAKLATNHYYNKNSDSELKLILEDEFLFLSITVL